MLAEQLLARACENEADNAKRMRMGMEPVSQVVMMMIMAMLVMMRNMARLGGGWGVMLMVNFMQIMIRKMRIGDDDHDNLVSASANLPRRVTTPQLTTTGTKDKTSTQRQN